MNNLQTTQRNIVFEKIESTRHISYIDVAREVRQYSPSLDELKRDSRQSANDVWRVLQEEKYHNKFSVYDKN